MNEVIKNAQKGIKEVQLQLMTLQEHVTQLSNINNALSSISLAEIMMEVRKKYDAM